MNPTQDETELTQADTDIQNVETDLNQPVTAPVVDPTWAAVQAALVAGGWTAPNPEPAGTITPPAEPEIPAST